MEENINEIRKMKLYAILWPRWKFYMYESYILLKNKIKKYHKEVNIRKKWYEFSISKWKDFTLDWSEANYDEGKEHITISILWFHLYIYTSQKYAKYSKETYDENQGDRHYGISIHNNAFWINNGLNYKAFEFPYTYRHIRHSILKNDNTMIHNYSKLGRKVYNIKEDERFYTLQKMKDGTTKKDYSMNFWDKKWDNILFRQVFDYIYILNDGTVQRRKVTIKVEEREWRRLILLWTPWKAKVNKYIEIEFDKEVGESSGSYKGGVVGTSYQFLNETETVEECFRRFEKNKKL